MENKINYQKELEKEIRKWSELEVCPTILLHSCCAPCSSYCLEYLSKYAKITAFYYNPNITDRAEYEHRVAELKRLIEEMHMENKAKFLEGSYDPDAFYCIAKGLEGEPECGRRCIKCYELRLRKTAEEAARGGYDYFTTTLTISPLKDAQILNRLGIKLGEEYGVKYLPSDFKKNGGYQRSIELSRDYNLYRQNYCGCEYSKGGTYGEKHT
jgi:predicted adenine nucleotide alpha hydrolase (AANH) superfamily ATPase